MTSGKMFDKQFLVNVRTSLACEIPTHLLHEEMEFLVKNNFLDCIEKNDQYGPHTKHYVGDPE